MNRLEALNLIVFLVFVYSVKFYAMSPLCCCLDLSMIYYLYKYLMRPKFRKRIP